MREWKGWRREDRGRGVSTRERRGWCCMGWCRSGQAPSTHQIECVSVLQLTVISFDNQFVHPARTSLRIRVTRISRPISNGWLIFFSLILPYLYVTKFYSYACMLKIKKRKKRKRSDLICKIFTDFIERSPISHRRRA